MKMIYYFEILIRAFLECSQLSTPKMQHLITKLYISLGTAKGITTCVPSEDSDQPAHLRSLIGVFARRSLCSQGPNDSSFGQQRL